MYDLLNFFLEFLRYFLKCFYFFISLFFLNVIFILYDFEQLCCFHMISLISDGNYPCVHYFLWRLPLCALLLCSMTHYDIKIGNNVARDTHCNITVGNDIAKDSHCDVTMSNGIAVSTPQCIMTFL